MTRIVVIARLPQVGITGLNPGSGMVHGMGSQSVTIGTSRRYATSVEIPAMLLTENENRLRNELLSLWRRRHITIEIDGVVMTAATELSAITSADTEHQAADEGTIPTADFEIGEAQPVSGDTMGIGADTYQFRTAGQSVTDDAYIAVLIGADELVTRTNLLAAVNAEDPNDRHASILNVAGTSPAKANGTTNVRAYVRDGFGGMTIEPTRNFPGESTSYPSNPSILLAENVTDPFVVWACGNVNMNTLGGASARTRRRSLAELTVSQGMVDFGSIRFHFPFAPVGYRAVVRTLADGLTLRLPDEEFNIDGDVVYVTIASLIANDILQLEVWD